MNEVPRERLGEYLELQGCPACSGHTDCFAWSEGRCTVLKEANDKECVFYKPMEQVRKENQAIYEKLVKNKRYDLLEKYQFIYADLGIEDPEFRDPEGIYTKTGATAAGSESGESVDGIADDNDDGITGDYFDDNEDGANDDNDVSTM